MATLATFFKRGEALVSTETSARGAPAVTQADPYRLRALPNEDVFLYSKRIDNSRLVREADPKSRIECWSTLAAAGIVVLLLTSVLAPGVASILAGYQIQELRKEEQRLLDERRVLELEEARLRSSARLDKLARHQRLVAPAPDQIVHLEETADRSLALNLKAEQ
jgi:cell division protein FtsL